MLRKLHKKCGRKNVTGARGFDLFHLAGRDGMRRAFHVDDAAARTLRDHQQPGVLRPLNRHIPFAINVIDAHDNRMRCIQKRARLGPVPGTLGDPAVRIPSPQPTLRGHANKRVFVKCA